MWTVLQLVLKGGLRTSEFWVTILGMGAAALLPLLEAFRDNPTTSPVLAAVAAVAVAIITAAYTVTRGKTKSNAINAAASATETTPGGNYASAGPGSVLNEEAHRSAVDLTRQALERVAARDFEGAARFLDQAEKSLRAAVTQAATSAAASP